MKKIISLVLCLSMCLVMLCMTSYAEETKTTYVEKGATWQYIANQIVEGEERAVAPEGWTTYADDATWSEGQAPFAGTLYTNTSANTVLYDYFDAYIRTTFTVEDASAVDALILNMIYDDDPVVYINGVEVWSASGYLDKIYNQIDLSDTGISALKDGENVLAINFKNEGFGGALMDLELIGYTDAEAVTDGKVNIRSAEGFGATGNKKQNPWANANLGLTEQAYDEDTSTVWGWGFEEGMYLVVSFYDVVDLNQIFIQTKNEGSMMNDTSTHGTYKIEALVDGEWIVVDDAVDALIEGLTLDTDVKTDKIKITITEWFNTNWALIAELAFYGEAVAEETVPTITITPFSKGWENWTGGTGGEQTQLLITAPIVPDATTKTYTWEITIGDKTITLKSSSQYNFGNGNAIWRFETCLAEGDNQYIPENGTSGTVSAKIYNEAGELVYVANAAADATWEVTMDPIVPAPAVPEAAIITLTPKFGAWENWKNSPNKGDAEAVTQLLVGIQENGATVDIDAALTWKLTIKGGDQDKTITLSPATKALAYDLYRFETCLAEGDNQFVPVNGVEYTVTIEVYEGETLKYKSEPTAGFTCPMDPIVPATEEPIDPPAVDPIDPPADGDGAGQAGDAAVYATILVAVAAVALVVISKKRTNI